MKMLCSENVYKHKVAIFMLLISFAVSCLDASKTDVKLKKSATAKGELGTDNEKRSAWNNGHDNNKEDISDLDRSAEELLNVNCEHGKKAFLCDECRYEVGIVKAEDFLFKKGLLTVVEAEMDTLTVPLELTGEIRFDERRVAHVNTLVTGIINKVYVIPGAAVKKGDALILIESIDAQNVAAKLKEAESSLVVAQENNDRISMLYNESIASKKEFVFAKQALDTAKIKVKTARGNIRRLGLVNRAESGRLLIRAPLSGTVLKMHAVAGEVAKPQKPLITIGNNDTVWVYAYLYEKDYASVINSYKINNLYAEVSVRAFPDKKFSGDVDFISSFMDENSRTIKIRIAVNNPDKLLLAGMFAKVNVFLPASEKVLSIPAGALLEDDGKQFVFVHAKDDYYLRRPVVKGREFSGKIEIKKGLKQGDIIIAKGAFLLKSDVLRSKMGAGCAD
jgi:cobalt-zinc-cadmium efflux system membrane fusion protein